MSPRSFVILTLLVSFLILLLQLLSNARLVTQPYEKQAYSAAPRQWRSESDISQHSAALFSTGVEEVLVAAADFTTATTGLPEPYVTQPAERNRPASGGKVIVIGQLQHEDTTWVQERLPDWQSAIYIVDNTSAPLHTFRNKGREANAYLLYIIQHYDRLPSTIAFLHPHRNGWPGGWHTDASNYDNVDAMNSLQIEFVQRNGYVNLRCNWGPGCPGELQHLRDPKDTPPENVEHHLPDAWRHFFGESSVVPEVVATPCCAQFAVSREQVLNRPLEDYQRYHQWLMDTTESDFVSGRILEYLWHVIFGKDAVYCPDMNQCYRDVYGRDT